MSHDRWKFLALTESVFVSFHHPLDPRTCASGFRFFHVEHLFHNRKQDLHAQIFVTIVWQVRLGPDLRQSLGDRSFHYFAVCDPC